MNTAPGTSAASGTASEAIRLLADLRTAGVTVTAAIDIDGPADALTDATLQRIRDRKPALLRLLVNPYRHRCINPQRQRVCDLIADAYDRDPLEAMHLAKTWQTAIDAARAAGVSGGDVDNQAWHELQTYAPP